MCSFADEAQFPLLMESINPQFRIVSMHFKIGFYTLHVLNYEK